jgi:hypothetical protein
LSSYWQFIRPIRFVQGCLADISATLFQTYTITLTSTTACSLCLFLCCVRSYTPTFAGFLQQAVLLRERRHLCPIPVNAQSKALVCGRLFAGIVGSNPAGSHGCLSLVSVLRCQVEVSASG